MLTRDKNRLIKRVDVSNENAPQDIVYGKIKRVEMLSTVISSCIVYFYDYVCHYLSTALSSFVIFLPCCFLYCSLSVQICHTCHVVCSVVFCAFDAALTPHSLTTEDLKQNGRIIIIINNNNNSSCCYSHYYNAARKRAAKERKGWI